MKKILVCTNLLYLLIGTLHVGRQPYKALLCCFICIYKCTHKYVYMQEIKKE